MGTGAPAGDGDGVDAALAEGVGMVEASLSIFGQRG
jgi:hypothetical protein